MDDHALQPAKAPWHFWLVGVLSLLWNLDGAVDFLMSETHNAAYLKNFTPAPLDYFNHFPLWVLITWGIATWGSVLGPLALLARRGLAVGIFLTSLADMVLTTLSNYGLTEGMKVMGGAGAVVFCAVIWLVAFLLWFYARTMRRCGVLRWAPAVRGLPSSLPLILGRLDRGERADRALDRAGAGAGHRLEIVGCPALQGAQHGLGLDRGGGGRGA